MSFCDIDGLNSYYKTSGSGQQAVVLLHGWGQNTEMMDLIQNHLAQHFTVYNFDFPGFGQSDMMLEAWSPDDFKLWLRKMIVQLGIENPILIGHSFGGHISMRYAATYEVKKLVLTGASGLKPQRGLDYYAKVYTYKVSKQLFKLPIIKQYKDKTKAQFGSSDYQNASGALKGTFVKVVNSFVDDLVAKINCPVLLVYGELDEDTPVWMGQKLEKLIPNAGLALFEGQGHYAYYVQSTRFNLVLDAFFKEDLC